MFGKKQEKEQENQDYKLIDAKKILQGLGGKANIKDISNCMTRLRLQVNDANIIDTDLLKHETGASNVFIDNDNVQVIYGLKIETIRKAVDEEMKK